MKIQKKYEFRSEVKIWLSFYFILAYVCTSAERATHRTPYRRTLTGVNSSVWESLPNKELIIFCKAAILLLSINDTVIPSKVTSSAGLEKALLQTHYFLLCYELLLLYLE